MPCTEIGRERVVPAGLWVVPAGLWLSHTAVQPWLSLSSVLLSLEFPHPSGPRRILSSLLLLSFLDLHPLGYASPSCSRMTNRALRFLTLPINSTSQAEQCRAYACVVLSMAQEGQRHRETVCLPATEETSEEEISKRGVPRVRRDLRQVAACASVHKHACRLKTLPSSLLGLSWHLWQIYSRAGAQTFH